MAGRKKAKSSKAGIAAILISVLALLSVVALVIGLFSDWYRDFSKFKLAGNKLPSEAETMYAPGKDMLINQTSANGIMLLSAEMPLEDFANYALDGNVE